MNTESTMRIDFPPALAARLEEAAQAEGVSPSDLIQELLNRREKDRSWRELVRRGQERGAAIGVSADEDAAIEFVNEKIAESRREQRVR